MWEAIIISGGIALGMMFADSVLWWTTSDKDYEGRGFVIGWQKVATIVFMALVVGVVF